MLCLDSDPFFHSFTHSLTHLFCPSLLRALHGDSVAVELLPEEEWSAPSSEMKHDYDDDEEENMEGGKAVVNTKSSICC